VELHEVVFAAVILGRFLVPLSIPVYPLPGILLSLLLDASDRAIYAQFVEIDVEAYQAYDKALDIYYLTLAYVATLRNWSNRTALQVVRFLWYYRLLGVALFEVTGVRWLLLVFPNAFEYFFVFYELVKCRWDPGRLDRRLLLWAAAVIWVCIKIPQEYWIHVAEGDTTDFIKVHVVGAPLEMPWLRILATEPWILAAIGLLAALLYLAARVVLFYLPPPDRPLAFHADAFVDTPARSRAVQWLRPVHRLQRGVLLEQVALVSLVAIIFGEILPGWEATALQVVTGVTVLIAVNAAVSVRLGRWGVVWRGAMAELAAMGAVNLGLVVIYGLAARHLDLGFHVGSALFFVALLTLIVTLHDRYRFLRWWREAMGRNGPTPELESGPTRTGSPPAAPGRPCIRSGPEGGRGGGPAGGGGTDPT
jgi:hypothetical protein